MPYPRAEAPSHVPDEETIESLLGQRNQTSKASSKVKPLQELNYLQRQRTGIIEPGKRKLRIQGDPWGHYFSWAGNVAHPEDARIYDILNPLCERLQEYKMKETEDVTAIQELLHMVPTTDVQALASNLADDGRYEILVNDDSEIVITCRIGSKSVRLMQATDIDVNDSNSFGATKRAALSASKARQLTPDPPMTIDLQQYLMALELVQNSKWHELEERGQSIKDMKEEVGTGKSGHEASSKKLVQLHKEEARYKKDLAKFFKSLRATIREQYWLQKTPPQRAQYRNACLEVQQSEDTELQRNLSIVKDHWQNKWNKLWLDDDFFHHYLLDQTAAQHGWDLVEDDVFIVTDRNRQVIFANIENLGELLFGREAMETLVRCLDMWTFFTPLPRPETSRHVVDEHIRRLHPGLDPSAVSIDHLHKAVMAVAHYGCWARKGDPYGKNIVRTLDTKFARTDMLDYPHALFPDFARAALGMASKMARFLIRPLDPAYYDECVRVFSSLPENARVSTDDEDFISLFALGVNGYTQRHRDVKDIDGGLAGLFSIGDYEGGNLCVPDLGIKVPYRPGTCLIIRGGALDHLVQDFMGTRYFIICTNHESCRQHALRKMGDPRAKPLPVDNKPLAGSQGGFDDSHDGSKARAAPDDEDILGGDGLSEEDLDESDDSDDDDMAAPCVNYRTDADDDLTYTNKQLHGPNVLHWSSSSSAASSAE